MKKRALISVSNKDGIVELAKGLTNLNYEILSTGGTARTLEKAGISVVQVEEVTQSPEILGGRVKTLHPNIHGGLLAKRNDEAHQAELDDHGIQHIDIVIANLYPFEETIVRTDVTQDEIIENIDIGGPTMLRAAAKNFEAVTVVVDPDDYHEVLTALQSNKLDQSYRKKLAMKVFRHTAHYDALIASYFTEQTNDLFPGEYPVTYKKVQTLRYGENPHQQAAFYQEINAKVPGIAEAHQLHGKELSYNNIQDANAALTIVAEFSDPAAVAVKHMNPCGVGVGETLEKAFKKVYDADPVSIFGGIVACNRQVDAQVAKTLREIFLEIIIAPSFSDEALTILTDKKNIRLLEMPIEQVKQDSVEMKSVTGGMLVQTADVKAVHEEQFTYPTKQKPTDQQIADLIFAQTAVKHVKSNAIVISKDGQTIGIGAGQMNRIGAAEIALTQAGENAQEAVLASDAFFPMPDTVEAAIKAGVTAIIQPGGSKRDDDSIAVCDEHGIAMVFTNVRHFKH